MTLSVKANFERVRFQKYWELLQVLVERNLKGRYRGSFLGIYWSLLNPVIMSGLYTAIFGTAFAAYYQNSIVNYILAAFTGLVVIHFFSASTTQALISVVSNGALLNKIRLPISVFPLATVAANSFQFAAGMLPVMVIVTAIKSHSLINVFALLFPFLSLILICAGFGFLTSALFVFFRDLPYFYELFTFVLWIGSPVFYPSEIVPETVKKFLIFNPLLSVMESFRQISLTGTFPDIFLICQALLNGLIIFGLGWSCFRWWQPLFMDLL